MIDDYAQTRLQAIQAVVKAEEELMRALGALHLEVAHEIAFDIKKLALAALAEAKASEREACAKMADSMGDPMRIGDTIAKAIRARGGGGGKG